MSKTKPKTKKKVPVSVPTVKAPVRQSKPRTSRGGLTAESSTPAQTPVADAIKVADQVEQRLLVNVNEHTESAIVNKAITLPDRARSITITNSRTFTLAADLVKDVVAIRKEITDHYAPLKDAAYKAHRLVCDAETKVLSPVADAERILKQSIGHYTTEQQRLDNERRRKSQEEDDARRQKETAQAIKDSEEKSATEIERLVLYEGFTLEDAMMRVNPGARVQQAVENVPVARTVVQLVTPRAQGVTVAPTYKVDVYDLKELCGAVYRGEYTTECVLPNMATLNTLARTLKEGFKMPGCRLDKGETVTVR